MVLVRLIGQRSLASMSSFDLGCVIASVPVMERNGSVSVLRQDAPVDPWLVADIDGARHRLAEKRGERDDEHRQG